MSEASAVPPESKSGFGSSLELPRILGRKILLRLLARGGMGDVYLAATTGLEGAERPCVVKTVRRDHIHDGSFLARFLDEARVQAQLNHPGVAQVLEAATDENGEPFTVVEYIEGRSLAEVRQRATQLGHKIGWADAVAMSVEMAMALSHIHTRAGADGAPLGIVHRDLSPQNVMMGYAGEVKLIDFGTARGQNRRCHTVAGVVFAKPGYVAPEIARHEVGDGRIDVYALGVMLWELCKNQRLLAGDAQKHLEDVARGRFTVPDVAASIGAPKELDVVIQNLIANAPDDRYANAAEAANDLAKLLAKATPLKSGERSVRARIATLMVALFPQEPSRSRGEFARLLQDAKATMPDAHTPPASGVVENAARQMEDPSMLPGTPYRLVRKIGEGATGTVWEAEHVELDRRVALKVLDAAHSSALESIDRFRKEARAVANLRHPNLAFLHDFGKSFDGRVFLAMEYLEGETVARRIERRALALDPVSWKEGVDIAIDATRALEAAHDAGLVHRDLKPENLFLTESGTLKLLDFGVAIAKSDAKHEEKKQRGFAIFGTPEYMAPEQVAGESVDARCDIYALGCVLYELSTGKRPFEGSSAVEIMGKQLREPVEAPRRRAPEQSIPQDLEAVILKAMAKKAEDRFGSAAELRAALMDVQNAPKKKRAKTKRNLTLAFSAALVSVVAAGVAYRDTVRQAFHHEAQATVAMVPDTVDVRDLPQVPSAALAQAPAPAPAPVAAAIAPSIGAPGGTEDQESTPAASTAAVHEPAKVLPPVEPTNDAPKNDTPALAQAREQAKAHPRDAKALRSWTRAALRAKDLLEAKRAAESWASYDPSSEPRIVQAQILDAMGRRVDAKNLLEAYLRKNPHSEDAKRSLGRMDTLPRLENASAKKPLH